MATTTEKKYVTESPVTIVHKNYPESDMNPFMAHSAADDDAASADSCIQEDLVLPIGDMEGYPVHYPEEGKNVHDRKVRQYSLL